jgi:uncharacterized protein YjiK
MKSTALRVIALLIIVWSCHSKGSKPESDAGSTPDSSTKAELKTNPSDYDLTKPEKKWELPADLLEISGNSWIDKDHLLAIEDLTPNLYLLRLDNNKALIEKKIPFKESTGKKFDVEDVTVVDNTAYALWSHGDIYKIKNWKNKPTVEVIKTFLTKDNNTEGMCYDPVTHNLLVACKNESDISDEKKSTRAVYEFDIASDSLKPEPFLLIHKKDIDKMTNEKLEFFPSALAVHPVTHDIYILSTKDTKCMAVYSHDGVLKSLQLIDKDLLPQPEGICFAPDGTLYISTEGKHDVPAFIFRFKKP